MTEPATGGQAARWLRKEAPMRVPTPFPATILRPPSPTASCSCEHWDACDCDCHGRYCDPSLHVCDLAFQADEGGVARWGCPDCTPGQGAPHYLGCELMGWNVPVPTAQTH